MYKVDPLDYLRRKHIGLAWFSPDCKHFSKAKGGKPVERNIRDLCWIIPGWIERIQKSGGFVDVIIMENVEEFKKYGPLIETDRGLMPDPQREGETFQKWCRKLRALGGKIEHRELRACDYGAPTIRKRLFVIIRFDGKPIVWPGATHGAPSDPDVIAGRKLPWRTAAEIIDWSQACPSIFDNAIEIMAKHGLRAVRPLADNTMARVARGMKRYVLDAKRPFLVSLKGSDRRDSSADEPHPTVLAGGGHSAVVSPSVIRFDTGATGSAMDEPLSTVTANGFIKRPGGAAPLGIIAPVITAAQHGGSNRSVEDPHHTITASKKDQNAVIVPTLVGCDGRAGQSRPRGGDEPTATITSKADVCVATAFIAQHNIDGHSGLGNPGRSANEPVSTVTATGAQQGVVSAFVSRQFGASIGHGADEPSATITAGVNKSALVTPYLVPRYGERAGQEPRTRGVDLPAPVIVPLATALHWSRRTYMPITARTRTRLKTNHSTRSRPNLASVMLRLPFKHLRSLPTNMLGRERSQTSCARTASGMSASLSLSRSRARRSSSSISACACSPLASSITRRVFLPTTSSTMTARGTSSPNRSKSLALAIRFRRRWPQLSQLQTVQSFAGQPQTTIHPLVEILGMVEDIQQIHKFS